MSVRPRCSWSATRRAIARFVASLGERDEVEEVVQDTFVRAFGSLDSFRGESTFRTWLLTIARNLLRDRQRSRKRARLHVEIQDNDIVSSSDALEGAVAAETEQRMQQAVESAVADAAFDLHIACNGRVVVQGDRDRGRKHGRRGARALSQRDAGHQGEDR